ncbi:MAG: SpoIIE family protein phosphatase [Rickettsiales bacterium]|nr:SpoIIE family protein phosphatase [Rickettsiales bacterium]
MLIDVDTVQRIQNAAILVVDDLDFNIKILVQSLRSSGFSNIQTAKNGGEALSITQQNTPDIVILDLMMPKVDGFEYCRQIRADRHYDNMPIVVQTALSDNEKKLTAFKLGANDYICKPFEASELSARVKVHLNQKFILEKLRRYQQQMQSELESARKIQNRLLPSPHQVKICERVYDMKIGHHFETTSDLGGDYWGIWPLSEERLAIFMFDFSGRGISTAMNVFRMHTFIQESLHNHSEPGYLLDKLNQKLLNTINRDELATMFYGVIDTEANCLLYASAASPTGLLFKPGQNTVRLPSSGFPLGIKPDAQYKTHYIPFLPDDLLVLHSDCISETQNSKGEFLADSQIEGAILQALRELPAHPANAVVESLCNLLKSHNPAPVFDDNTITVYHRKPE